jgi:uncharacterized protein (TIGR02246 family)
MIIHRTLAFITLATITLPGCQRRAESLTDADRNAITAVIANFDKAMLAADWPAVLSAYTEDAILLPPNTPVVQGRAVMQKFFEGFPKITEFKQRVVEIEGYGDLAFPRGTYETTMNPTGAKAPLKDRGKILAVWRKQPDGKWLASRVIWNSDLAPTR